MEGKVRSEIGVVTESMLEYVCDCLCRFPGEAERQKDLVPICDKCKMGQYISDLNIIYKL